MAFPAHLLTTEILTTIFDFAAPRSVGDMTAMAKQTHLSDLDRRDLDEMRPIACTCRAFADRYGYILSTGVRVRRMHERWVLWLGGLSWLLGSLRKPNGWWFPLAL